MRLNRSELDFLGMAGEIPSAASGTIGYFNLSTSAIVAVHSDFQTGQSLCPESPCQESIQVCGGGLMVTSTRIRSIYWKIRPWILGKRWSLIARPGVTVIVGRAGGGKGFFADEDSADT